MGDRERYRWAYVACCPMSVLPLLIPRRLRWAFSLAAPWPQFLLLVLLSLESL